MIYFFPHSIFLRHVSLWYFYWWWLINQKMSHMFDCVLFLKWFSEFCDLMFCKSLILEFNINLFNGKSMILLSLRLNFIHKAYGTGYYRNKTCYKPNVLIFNWRHTGKRYQYDSKPGFLFCVKYLQSIFNPELINTSFRERGFSMCNIFPKPNKVQLVVSPPPPP